MATEPRTLAEATASSEKEAVFWLDQIKQASRVEEKWRQRAEQLVKKYRNAVGAPNAKYNVFWANTQLLKPRVYGQLPSADVRRRSISEDEFTRAVGNRVATTLERALAYAIDAANFDAVMKAVRDDVLIVGRGVARLVYEPDIVVRRDIIERQEVDPDTGATMPVYILDGELVMPDFDDDGPFVEQKGDERLEYRYVHWADYRQSPARQWADVWWVAFRHTWTRDEMRDVFPDANLKDIPFAIAPGHEGRDEDTKQPADPEHAFGRAEVWEIWNRRARTRVWVATGHDKLIRKDDDPLNLEGFYPLPEPVRSVPVNDDLVPTPEYDLYCDQAEELNELQDRIRHLARACKALQFVDGDAVEVVDVQGAKDGTMIPATSPGRTVEDLSKSIVDYPIQVYAAAIQNLSLRAQEVKNQIFEIVGLGDTARGEPKPRVTAAAERFAGRFGEFRMTPRSEPMALFIRDMLRLSAEVMAEMFDRATLGRIGGMQITPDMQQLMQVERFRNTQIEVQSDSTIRPDRFQQKQEAIEFLTAVAQYLGAAAPVAAQVPALAPLLMSMLQEAARTFKFGRRVEAEIDQLAGQAASVPAQPAAPVVGNGALPPGMVQ